MTCPRLEEGAGVDLWVLASVCTGNTTVGEVEVSFFTLLGTFVIIGL